MIRADITYNDYCQSCGRNMGIVLNYRVYNNKTHILGGCYE